MTRLSREQYNDLSNIGKHLLTLLYGNEENVLQNGRLEHPLEKYILAYDSNMDNDSAIRSIGERIGIYIPDRQNSAEVFYIKLSDHILNHERIKRSVGDRTYLSSKEIIDLTPDQYSKKTGSYNLDRDTFYPMYADRLSQIGELKK